MPENIRCYWSREGRCGTTINQNLNNIFIIGSCDPERQVYIDKIKDIVENEFHLNAIFAEDLSHHNGQRAFCSNICSYIIGCAMVIVDLSAPKKNFICQNCEQNIEIFQQSVNTYWEYGYACGLAKKFIVIIDETQIHSLPFDIADVQVERYNLGNLNDKLRRLIGIKLNEPFPLDRYNIIPPSLPSTPIGPNDHRIQILIELIKYKLVDYYYDIRHEKKLIIRRLIELLGAFNQIFFERFGRGRFNAFIGTYFNCRNPTEFQNRIRANMIQINLPHKPSLVIAGDFALKLKNYKEQHPELNTILIDPVHGEFDTEIRNHKIFPHQMSFDRDFIPALRELRIYGIIRGEEYTGHGNNCTTEFNIPSQAYLNRFIESFSLDYYFTQYFNRI